MNDRIKQAIYDELAVLLQKPGQQTEERLKQLEFTEEYGIILAQFALDDQLDIGIRTLASVMLKKYVDEHWCNDDDTDQTKLVASDHAKHVIKTILPKGLYSNNSKIRNTVAYTISSIAGFDWPSDWVELFDIIFCCLSGNEDSVSGAMRVLVEFTLDLEERVKDVGPIILSQICRIFTSDATFGVKTRTTAIEILNSLLKCANTHVDQKEQAKILNAEMPGFMQKMIEGLMTPNGDKSDFALKTEIIKAFTYMINEMGKFVQPFLSSLLPPIWTLLTQMADIYIKTVVSTCDVDPFAEEEEKSDFIKMILQIFELVHSIAESKKFKVLIKDVIGDLVYVLILYMQITDEQMEVWMEDSEKYIEDDLDEDGVDYSIRTSGQDILVRLGEEFEDKFLVGLTQAIGKHITLANAERENGKENWWKTHEATMLVVGSSSFKDLIMSREEFDLREYLNLVMSLMIHRNHPFLLGRCVVTLSKYIETDACSAHFSDTIQITIECLSPELSMIHRINAVRAIYLFCSNLKENENERKAFLTTKLEAMHDGIITIIPIAQSTLMGLVLESLKELLAFDVKFTGMTAARIIPLIQTLFLKFYDDRFILEHIQEILKIWSQNPYCLASLEEKMIPTLVNILNMHGDQDHAPLQDIALDVLETIAKYSKPPLSSQMIENAFPAAVNAILRTEDHSVMQSGGECLRAFLYVAPEQVCTYQNGQGLSYILQVTTMLLNPMATEFSASFIGRLVVTLITKAGNYLGDQIDLLLKAVISKMQLVESLNVIMSLVMTFAHLFLIQMDAVMNFLSSVPGPTGEPAMNFVFSTWLSRQHWFYGTYERKVSVMALCKIFEYGITTQDQRLIQVTIKDVMENPNSQNAGVKTRSQGTNTQWVTIPVMVKIFKLLINELSNLREVKSASNKTYGGSDDEDEESDGEELGDTSARNLNAFMLFDDEETTDDDNQLLQDLMNDPIFQEDTEVALTKFITNFSRDENYKAFVSQLTLPEKKLLESLNIEN